MWGGKQNSLSGYLPDRATLSKKAEDKNSHKKERISQAVQTLDPTYRTVITVDREPTVNELES